MSDDQGDLNALKEEYLSQIRGMFPLYRAVLLFVALVVVVAVQKSEYKSVSEGLLRLQIRTLADFNGGFFAGVVVLDALLAGGLLVLGTVLHRLGRWLFFAWLKKRLKIEEIAKTLSAKSAASKDGTIASYFVLKRSESEASSWGKKVSGLSLMSESALALFLIFVYAAHFGNLIDYGLAIVFFVCGILAQARSFIVFLKHYLPHAMHIQGLLGRGGDVNLPS